MRYIRANLLLYIPDSARGIYIAPGLHGAIKGDAKNRIRSQSKVGVYRERKVLRRMEWRMMTDEAAEQHRQFKVT